MRLGLLTLAALMTSSLQGCTQDPGPLKEFSEVSLSRAVDADYHGAVRLLGRPVVEKREIPVAAWVWYETPVADLPGREHGRQRTVMLCWNPRRVHDSGWIPLGGSSTPTMYHDIGAMLENFASDGWGKCLY